MGFANRANGAFQQRNRSGNPRKKQASYNFAVSRSTLSHVAYEGSCFCELVLGPLGCSHKNLALEMMDQILASKKKVTFISCLQRECTVRPIVDAFPTLLCSVLFFCVFPLA